MHSHVARLNLSICRMDWNRNWPEPSTPSKPIRYIAHLVGQCWLKLKGFISSLRHYIMRVIRQPSPQGQVSGLGDLEGGNELHELAILPQENAPLVTQSTHAKNEYLRTLQDKFGEEKLINVIMMDIQQWESLR